MHQNVCLIKLYAMHRVHVPEVTLELLSRASKANMVVLSWPASIVNRDRFCVRDVRLKKQNIGVLVPGTRHEIFYA